MAPRMKALRTVGVPYTDEQITAPGAVLQLGEFVLKRLDLLVLRDEGRRIGGI